MKQKIDGLPQHTVRLKHHTSKMTVIVFHLKEKKTFKEVKSERGFANKG